MHLFFKMHVFYTLLCSRTAFDQWGFEWETHYVFTNLSCRFFNPKMVWLGLVSAVRFQHLLCTWGGEVPWPLVCLLGCPVQLFAWPCTVHG